MGTRASAASISAPRYGMATVSFGQSSICTRAGELIFALGFENRRFASLHIEPPLERAPTLIVGFNDETVLATSREDHQRSGPAGGLVST